MKVGTDGVLLGAWVGIRGSERNILDIGTGSGVIALMMAQRNSGAMVDAVEIEAESAQQASENFEASDWSDRLVVHHVDIQGFNSDLKYDLIVTNPPYFVESLLSPDAGRTTARHTTQLSFSELIEAVIKRLKPDGRFAMILPVEESQMFDREAEGRLHLTRRCAVYGREDLAAKRYLSEYVSCCKSVDKIVEERLVIEGASRGEYTAEYRELTREFYLKF